MTYAISRWLALLPTVSWWVLQSRFGIGASLIERKALPLNDTAHFLEYVTSHANCENMYQTN
jgi:hypothetical protein